MSKVKYQLQTEIAKSTGKRPLPVPIPKRPVVVTEGEALSDAEKTKMRLQVGSLKKKIKEV